MRATEFCLRHKRDCHGDRPGHYLNKRPLSRNARTDKQTHKIVTANPSPALPATPTPDDSSNLALPTGNLLD